MARYYNDFCLHLFPDLHTLILSDSRVLASEAPRRLDDLTLHVSNEVYAKYLECNIKALEHVRVRQLCIKVDCPISDQRVDMITRMSRKLLDTHGNFQLYRD